MSGPSGSGKTILLRCLSGLDRPDEGRIENNGQLWFDSWKKINLSAQKQRALEFLELVGMASPCGSVSVRTFKQEAGVTTLFVALHSEDIRRLCQKAVTLREGRLADISANPV